MGYMWQRGLVTEMKAWLIKKFAGSAADKAYQNTFGLLHGYKTYIVGASMVLQGLILLVDKWHGTGIGQIQEMLRDPAISQIAEGLGLMTVRHGIQKSLISPAKAPRKS